MVTSIGGACKQNGALGIKSNQCQKYPVPLIQFTIGRVLIVRVGYKSYGAVFTTILVTSNAVWGGPLSNVAS